MEENNKKCDCFLCHCGKHTWFRWVLGVIILWAVFALGVKIGELKYAIKDGLRGYYYGYSMMGGWNDNSYGSYGCGRGDSSGYFPNMMNFWSNKLRNATSTQ